MQLRKLALIPRPCPRRCTLRPCRPTQRPSSRASCNPSSARPLQILSVDRPPSATSSSNSHTTSNSTSTSFSGGKRRFLGLGKDRACAKELLAVHEAQHMHSPDEYDFDDCIPGSPPSAYGGTARPRTRSERHFSASTLPSSSGHSDTLQLQRTPSRLGVDGPLAVRLCVVVFLQHVAQHVQRGEHDERERRDERAEEVVAAGRDEGVDERRGVGVYAVDGESLLVTALQRIGDTPSTPPFPPRTPSAHAEHAQLLSWFLDAPATPFGVHRMALTGKAAGKVVGIWFGPSAAAAAMRTLVDAFPACGLGVSVATDGTLYQTEFFAASHSPASLAALHTMHTHSSSHSSSATPARSPGSSAGHSTHSKGHGKPETKVWDDRPVLLLLGIRLGLDGVNAVYHETIKLLYTFPQSVGIAGGRPSSSYYFVGVQENGLFYLDPHHSRPESLSAPSSPTRTTRHPPRTPPTTVRTRRTAPRRTTTVAH